MEQVETKKEKKVAIRVVPKIDYAKSDVYTIAMSYIPNGWNSLFENPDVKYELKDVSETLEYQEKHGDPWFPQKKDLFRAFHLTPLNKVRVVIFGQDPYAQYGIDGLPRPTGLSFSVRKTDEIPASLRNIFEELLREYPNMKTPYHGCLESWTKQGVFLLNSSLTVKIDESGSHPAIWDGFLVHVINAINNKNPKCIYVLWGAQAKKLKKYIGTKPIILEAAHPSSRNKDVKSSFIGNGHFLKINELLKSFGQEEINWEV